MKKKVIPHAVKVIPEMQLAWEAVGSICPTLNIKFEYNEEEYSIGLDQSFFVSYCKEEKKPYIVSFAKYYPGDRETPPDVDIIDLQSFEKPISAVRFAVEELLKSLVEQHFSDFSAMKYEEESAKIEKELSHR